MRWLVIAVASAVICFGQSGSDARARAVLSEGAAQGDPDHRREVAVALSLISPRDSAATLLDKMVRDSDHVVRETAIVTIGELNDRGRVRLVKAALDDTVPEVAFAAARTLYQLKEPTAAEALLSIVEQETKAESGFLRSRLRGIIRKMKTPRSAMLFTVEQGIRFVPVPGVGAGFSAMGSMLFDADFSPRASALLALSKNPSPQVRSVVVKSLKDEDWSVRAAAVQILGNSRRAAHQKDLVPLFEDTNRKVRYRAAAAYLRLLYSGGR